MKNLLRFSIATRIRDSYAIDLLKPKKGDLILDLGCGIGYHCEFLSNLGTEVFGVDIDREAVITAKELYPDINFLVCNADNIPFKADSFNKVICTEVLEHVENDCKVIKEIYRITKSGGLVLITVPCLEGIFGSLFKDIGHSNTADFEKHFKKGYSIDSIKKLIKSNGLTLLSYSYSMTLFSELYMGLTKSVFLYLTKDSFRKQSDLRTIDEDNLILKLNKLLLPFVLMIGLIEDKILSKLIKGHMLIALCKKE